MNKINLIVWFIINISILILMFFFWKAVPFFFFMFGIFLTNRLIMTRKEKEKWEYETFMKPQPKSTIITAALIVSLLLGSAFLNVFYPQIFEPSDDSKWEPVIRYIFPIFMGISFTFTLIKKIRTEEINHNQGMDFTGKTPVD